MYTRLAVEDGKPPSVGFLATRAVAYFTRCYIFLLTVDIAVWLTQGAYFGLGPASWFIIGTIESLLRKTLSEVIQGMSTDIFFTVANVRLPKYFVDRAKMPLHLNIL